MEKMYKYTMGIDPSGAFKEGSGTTGWCVLDNATNKLLEVGTIAAKDYNSYHDYWEAHTNLIKQLTKRYNNMAVSIEDYILYKSHAMDQVNSQLETVQLLGIIKQFCWSYAIDYFIRPAVAVKKRWADNILVYKGILIMKGKHYMVPATQQLVCEHERDSIRHAVHFNTFENREVN
jgi:Holliday junction resolvasome RuvABC endonuclease subunit